MWLEVQCQSGGTHYMVRVQLFPSAFLMSIAICHVFYYNALV